jgi:TonB family protein
MVRVLVFLFAFAMMALASAPAQIVVGGSGRPGSEKVVALNSPRPEYPPSLKEHGVGGQGVFLVYLDAKTGAVTRVEVRQSTGVARLDKLSVQALRQWRFKTPLPTNKIKIPLTFVPDKHTS